MITPNTHPASPKPARLAARLGTTVAGVLALSMATLNASPAAAQNPPAVTPSESLTLSVGRGSMVRLDRPMTDLFVSNDAVADVQIRSSTQLYIFGKGKGETTIYATDKAGRVVFSANVRVGNNLQSIDDMLRVTMPEAAIQATPMNGIVLLTGTVATPGDVEEANRLVTAFVGEGTQVISRLKTATPLQVNLQVKIVEVNRDYAKNIGLNLLTRDQASAGGFLFGIARGPSPGTIADRTSGTIIDPRTGNPAIIGTDFKFNGPSGAGTVLNLAGRFLGLDVLAALNLAEDDGNAHTLAEPNLTALSGETASFLAGGEIPIPVPQLQGAISIEFKQYGVSLAFTPYVLSDGRISMRVRPEVSQLTASSVSIGGYAIPGLSTRRAETTVELGSGQSFVIGGLLTNNSTNAINKTPFLGDLPILGSLFRSTSFRKSQSELIIVVTPYLVKPVSANRIALPTDGFRNPSDVERIIEGQSFVGQSGPGTRPVPRIAPPRTVRPNANGTVTSRVPAVRGTAAPKAASAQPGFSL